MSRCQCEVGNPHTRPERSQSTRLGISNGEQGKADRTHDQARRKIRLRWKCTEYGLSKMDEYTYPLSEKKTNSDKRKAQRRSGNITRWGQISGNSEPRRVHLIHMLAKHATPINASKTVLGRVPAMLSTLVIRMRSIAVLLKAAAIVNPPINSMMVGENITENMYLIVMRAT